ncbi:MAG: N-acetylmuramoyl-L-alanine amidase [Candidatus Dojkabacteria bacterium]|nr:N-acetylmuramoyl-L-alanine amidase [Candidatus Dojkabacteria bacterium]
MTGFRVLIGAGHTTQDPGKKNNDIKEFEVSKTILELVYSIISQTTIEFQIVPIDLNVYDRVEWINTTGYSEAYNDIYIEIHLHDRNEQIIQLWYKALKAENNKSLVLANTIGEYISKKRNIPYECISEYNSPNGLLTIFNVSVIPICIEILSINNPSDIEIIKNKSALNDIAKALVEAISHYLNTIQQNNQVQVIDTTLFKSTSEIQTNTTQNNLNSLSNSNNQYSQFATSQAQNTVSTTTAIQNDQQSKDIKNFKLLSIEERKKIINEIYLKVLGRPPTLKEESDISISTDVQLINKLLDSQEHQDILNKFKQSKELEIKIKELEEKHNIYLLEQNTLKKNVDSLIKINKIKDKVITILRKKLVEAEITKKGEFFDVIKAELEYTLISSNTNSPNSNNTPNSLQSKNPINKNIQVNQNQNTTLNNKNTLKYKIIRLIIRIFKL